MWFKKLSQVLTFLTALVLFTVSSVVAPVVPQSENRLAIPADAPSLLVEANRLSWLENWTAAGPLYARAELLFRADSDKRNEIYARIGRIRAMGEESDWEDVSRTLQKQLANPVVKTDRSLLLWCLALKGYADLDLDTESAKRSWTEALGIAEGLGEAQWASRAKGELGVIAFLEGNPTRAVSLVGQALLSLVASKDAAGEARLLTMLGDGYNEVHRFAEADWFFQRAISIMERTPDAGFPFNAEVGDAQALAGEGHQTQAEDLLTKLLTRAKREKKYWHETDVLIALGELAIKAQDMERARAYLERAAELSKTFHLYRDQAMVMIDLAGVYRIQGDLKSADAAVKVGLTVSRHVGDRYYLPRNLTAAAELKVAENEPKQADLLFEEAEDVIDGMVLNQHTDYGKAALAGSMSETYVKHFHLVQKQGNVARALHLLERVRGRASASRLYEPRDSTSDSPARATLEANIAAVQVSLLATDDQKARLALQDQLLQNERNLAFEDNELSRTQWSWLAPVSLASVQKVLKKDELLLEYVLDDPHAFCIAVTANDARIIQLSAGSRQIQHLTGSYLRELKARSSSQQLAGDLYTVLLKDATQAFHQARLIIAPDGILNFLPFEALRGADGKFIVSSTVVSYTPSATALWALRTAKTQAAIRPLLAIGDVDYADRRVSRESRPRTSWVPAVFRDLAELSSSHMQNLPESRQEVLSIARIAGADSKVLLGRDATETAFKAQPISQYRVVHLAVHAIADSQYPDRSALVLAADNPPEDGLLQVREITRLHLNADLVTLSACQTGVGPTEGEAGVISLEQAFLMAGAKAVVASLWNVEDQSTTVLMEAFYRHLAEHEDKAMALAHAKGDVLERSPNISAYYWAGFVIVGEGAGTVSFGN